MTAPELVIVPAHPGPDGARSIEFEVCANADGRTVQSGFCSVTALVRALGRYQPWVCATESGPGIRSAGRASPGGYRSQGDIFIGLPEDDSPSVIVVIVPVLSFILAPVRSFGRPARRAPRTGVRSLASSLPLIGKKIISAERRRRDPGNSVTFCDGRTFIATASGQTQLTAGILAAVQVVRPRLAAGAPCGPRLRADSDRNREEDGT